jgi:hypothetical protein
MYRAAITRYLHCKHQSQQLTSASWESIWTIPLQFMLDVSKTRVPLNNKKNNKEKIDYLFAPYQLVNHFGDIEGNLWDPPLNNSTRSTLRSALTWLRHRYCFLHSCHGILRAHSIFDSELSDCLMIRLRGEPHHMWLLIQFFVRRGVMFQEGICPI